MNHNRIETLEEKEKDPVRIATIVGIVSIILNLCLGLTKIVVGKVANSNAVFSDGVHGTGDVFTTIIAVVSIWIAARKKNKQYNYGYERWASIGSMILAIILFILAGEIIIDSTHGLIDITQGQGEAGAEAFSGMWWLSLSLALGSIAVKLVMFFITMYAAKKAHSKAMVADAWHQIVDALSSAAAIIALLGSIWLPNNILDPIFTYPIAIMVIWVGVSTFIPATKELTDHAISEEKLNEVKETLYTIISKEQVKMISSRMFSEKFYLEIYILENENMTLKESDDISDKIKETLLNHFDDLKNVFVIVQPDDDFHRNQREYLR